MKDSFAEIKSGKLVHKSDQASDRKLDQTQNQTHDTNIIPVSHVEVKLQSAVEAPAVSQFFMPINKSFFSKKISKEMQVFFLDYDLTVSRCHEHNSLFKWINQNPNLKNDTAKQWQLLELLYLDANRKPTIPVNGKTLEQVQNAFKHMQNKGIIVIVTYSAFPQIIQKRLTETLKVDADYVICDIAPVLEKKSDHPVYTVTQNPKSIKQHLVLIISGTPPDVSEVTKMSAGHHFDYAYSLLAKMGYDKNPHQETYADDDRENYKNTPRWMTLIYKVDASGSHWDEIVNRKPAPKLELFSLDLSNFEKNFQSSS